MHKYLKKYFGPKDFYKKTAKIAVPLSLQNLLSSCMGIIDTLMVSWIGMVTAVGTAAQIDTLCSMIAYGSIGGTSMFSSQFYGAKDFKNLKKTFGLSIILASINALFWFSIATFLGYQILMFYMPDANIVAYSLKYLNITRFGLVLGSINFAFSYMYRSIQNAGVSLKVSILVMICNIVMNSCFIFGIGFFPKMGVEGAALGTVIAQCLGLIVYVIHAIKTKQPFFGTFREMFVIEKEFALPILRKVVPLIFNETLFGVGSTLFIKAFGQLGKDSMDAYYVGNQIYNTFLFIVYGYGNAISVLLGVRLGSGEMDEAKREANYHLGLSLILSIILVVGMILFANPMVAIFGLTNPLISLLAIQIVWVFAVKVSMRLFNFIIFSILRAGGESKVIQLLDSGILWVIGLPSAFICVNLLHMNSIVIVLLITQVEQLVRLGFGILCVKSESWAKDLTVLVD
ncbi:MAG: MATE family efflux transporter [Anaerorhabdus sp.]|uniref:MATE family efflux transporter n=1 Tax=Anaerorhabdus sp. TaxID=1872524 RepID=UPI003A8929D0